MRHNSLVTVLSQDFNSRRRCRRAPVHHHPVVRWLRHRQRGRQCRDRRKRHVPDRARMGRQLARHCWCTRIRRVGHLRMLTRLGHHHADNAPPLRHVDNGPRLTPTSTLAICRLNMSRCCGGGTGCILQVVVACDCAGWPRHCPQAPLLGSQTLKCDVT